MTAAAMLRRSAVETIRRYCVVPEPLTVTEWADRYRMLPDTSASPGRFRSSVAPYARRWMDLGGDPGTSRIVLCWAAQTTKSTVIENILGYRIHRTPSPMVVVQPKIDAAESWAKERLRPMIVATPVLRERVQLGRATESTMRYLRFPNGFCFVASAGSASELASRSAPFVSCDEVDRYEVIPGEGNPVEIIGRRQASSDVGLEILTSTPRDAEATIIWPYLEAGTYEFYHVPCPLCARTQRLEFGRLHWEDGRPREAWYRCVHCDRPFPDTDKPEWLAAGDWVASNPTGEYPSSHLNALYSPFAKSNWVAIKDEWKRAQGKPADLQVFVNTRLAELWEEKGDALKGDALLQRLEPATEGLVPPGVGLLTAGIDVQAAGGGRVEVYVWGWGAGLESWLVASFVLPGDPETEPDQPDSVWQKVDEVLGRSFSRADGGAPMRIACALVDSGYAATKVYRYVRRRASRRVYACKGLGGTGVPILGKPSTVGKERVILYMVGVDAAKTEFIRSQLPTPTRGPGYVHLPDWLTSEQVDQLVSERRMRRVQKGRVIYEWRPKTEDSATEALDCRNYARAALEVLGARKIAQLGALAARAGRAAPAIGTEAPPAADAPPPDDPLTFPEDAPAPAPPRRPTSRRTRGGGGGWMSGFR